MLKWLYICVGVALGVTLSSPPVYLYGKYEGKRISSIEALQKSVDVLHKRGEINDEVYTSDAHLLCANFGLSVDDEAECVRRLREADPKR